MGLRTEDQTPRRRLIQCAAATLLAAAVLSGACSDGYVPPSETADGEAADTGGPEAGTDIGSDAQSMDGMSNDTGSGTTDGGNDGSMADADEDTSGSNSCSVEGDGEITHEEVPLRAGLTALFRVAQDVEVDTAGSMKEGTRHWNFDKSYSGDQTEAVELQRMEGKWFKPDFPEADYAMKLTGQADELGVFEITDEALLMLGVVSPTDEGTTTNISYDPPVAVLDFPLEKGKTWKTETTAKGTHAVWSPYTDITYEETYTSQVDARGTLATPHSEFDVLRVRTKLEREASITGVPLETIRTFAFVTECFGTVATVRSKGGETETEFSEAAEIRRLTK